MSTLTYREFGTIDGPTVLFLHGWPDTDVLFQHQYPIIEKTHRIVAFTLPLYSKDQHASSTSIFGPPLEEVAAMLRRSIKEVMTGRPEWDRPALVCHDWGAVMGWHVVCAEPNLVSKVVALDIGQHSGKRGLTETFFLIAYQWTLIFLFLLPSFLGDPLTALLAKTFGAPNPAKVHARMNYLYLQTWRLIFTNSLPKSLTHFSPPPVPILFLYGKRCPVRFFSKRWLEYIEKTPGCKAVGYDADHWFFTRSKCVAAVNDELTTFLGQ